MINILYNSEIGQCGKGPSRSYNGEIKKENYLRITSPCASGYTYLFMLNLVPSLLLLNITQMISAATDDVQFASN